MPPVFSDWINAAARRIDGRQVLKWTVYSLLLVNGVYFMLEEVHIASHTLGGEFSLLQWTEEFDTTLDELAWFGLLFLFEFETHTLASQPRRRRRLAPLLHTVRAMCYLFIAHTVLARWQAVRELAGVGEAPGITGLCQLAGQDVSFAMNFRYQEVGADNCAALSGDSQFYFIEPGVVTDQAGFALERLHAWVDLNDAIVWLLVIGALELVVRFQGRGMTGRPVLLASHAARFFYAVLFAHAIWWSWTGHWVYAWDQFLWIVGFWAIEQNLSDWRNTLREDAAPVPV